MCVCTRSNLYMYTDVYIYIDIYRYIYIHTHLQRGLRHKANRLVLGSCVRVVYMIYVKHTFIYVCVHVVIYVYIQMYYVYLRACDAVYLRSLPSCARIVCACDLRMFKYIRVSTLTCSNIYICAYVYTYIYILLHKYIYVYMYYV